LPSLLLLRPRQRSRPPPPPSSLAHHTTLPPNYQWDMSTNALQQPTSCLYHVRRPPCIYECTLRPIAKTVLLAAGLRASEQGRFSNKATASPWEAPHPRLPNALLVQLKIALSGRDDFGELARPHVSTCTFDVNIHDCSQCPKGSMVEEVQAAMRAWSVDRRACRSINTLPFGQGHARPPTSIVSDVVDMDGHTGQRPSSYPQQLLLMLVCLADSSEENKSIEDRIYYRPCLALPQCIRATLPSSLTPRRRNIRDSQTSNTRLAAAFMV